MTTAADSANETAFEAVLAGRPVPPGTPGLGAVTAFTEAVRATATQPVRPNAALAELLANGLILDQPSPSPRTAKRRRRRMWFFSAILAKIAGASAVAQAATGAGIVLVGFTGAGMAGVLPNPVQSTFATVVSNITPITPAGASAADSVTSSSADTSTSSSSSATEPGDLSPADETATSSPATDAPAGYSCSPDEPFGTCMSEYAKHGKLSAGQVSLWARYYQEHRSDKNADQSDDADSDASRNAASLSTAPAHPAANGHGESSQHGNGHGNS